MGRTEPRCNHQVLGWRYRVHGGRHRRVEASRLTRQASPGHLRYFAITDKRSVTKCDNVSRRPMEDAPLNTRRQEILHAIVRAYIETGEPVGSSAVARGHSLSGASIRNMMAALAEEGYLSQPHT